MKCGAQCKGLQRDMIPLRYFALCPFTLCNLAHQINIPVYVSLTRPHNKCYIIIEKHNPFGVNVPYSITSLV